MKARSGNRSGFDGEDRGLWFSFVGAGSGAVMGLPLLYVCVILCAGSGYRMCRFRQLVKRIPPRNLKPEPYLDYTLIGACRGSPGPLEVTWARAGRFQDHVGPLEDLRAQVQGSAGLRASFFRSFSVWGFFGACWPMAPKKRPAAVQKR